ncbi:MAG: hypothetical protein SFU87_12530 [Chitinophagaceae bacterium]|nr:hypothetical protein [Chitinophagaceae bacterium]
MKKVTYLFGAGASANCLPIVVDIPDRLNSFINFIHDNRIATQEVFASLGIQKSIFEIEEEIMNDTRELINEVKAHASIDTYAKKLRITASKIPGNLKKYNSLKVVLSTFFIYEQLRQRVDSRYDSFFASILKDSHIDFTENIRIVSWNYDFQFEKAYSAFSGETSLHSNQVLLKVFPSDLATYNYQEGFSIFKVNGTTGYYNKSDGRNSILYDDISTLNKKELIKNILWLYAASVYKNNDFRSLLSFAWERNWERSTQEFLKLTYKAVADTEVLVIIGYSFPFFNREIDRSLLSSMEDQLKKIYVQDKKPQSVIDKLSSVLPETTDLKRLEIFPYETTDQFYLPPEL